MPPVYGPRGRDLVFVGLSWLGLGPSSVATMPDEPKTNYTRYPVEGMDQWLSSGGCNALDPYTFYTNLRPLEKIFG